MNLTTPSMPPPPAPPPPPAAPAANLSVHDGQNQTTETERANRVTDDWPIKVVEGEISFALIFTFLLLSFVTISLLFLFKWSRRGKDHHHQHQNSSSFFVYPLRPPVAIQVHSLADSRPIHWTALPQGSSLETTRFLVPHDGKIFLTDALHMPPADWSTVAHNSWNARSHP